MGHAHIGTTREFYLRVAQDSERAAATRYADLLEGEDRSRSTNTTDVESDVRGLNRLGPEAIDKRNPLQSTELRQAGD